MFHSDLEAELTRLRYELEVERKIVDRIWDIFGRPSYEELEGKSLYDLVSAAQAESQEVYALKQQNERLRNELHNFVRVKRFDRDYFDDDSCFADWVQSRARAALAADQSWGKE